MTDERKYVSLGEAADRLGVTRPTLYYYMKKLEIEKKTFKLDKRAYIEAADFEQMKALRNATLVRHGQKEILPV